MQGQLHGLLQGKLDYSGRTCRSLLSEGRERKRRMQRMQATVMENNVYRWAGKILSTLLKIETPETA